MSELLNFHVLWFILFLLLWLCIFLAGSFFDAGLYLKNLKVEQRSDLLKFFDFFRLMGTYTWSNILLLCCLSSILGDYGRVAMTNSKKLTIMAALVRGFFIYLFLTAGQLIFTGSLPIPESSGIDYSGVVLTSENDYRRLSGICSLFAFTAGFKPEFFESYIKKLTGTISEET